MRRVDKDGEIAEAENSPRATLVKKPFTYWTLFDPGVLFMETLRDEKNGVGRFSSNAREICRERATFRAPTRCIHTYIRYVKVTDYSIRRKGSSRKGEKKRKRNFSKSSFFFSPTKVRKETWGEIRLSQTMENREKFSNHRIVKMTTSCISFIIVISHT